jgi:hypothetical protein
MVRCLLALVCAAIMLGNGNIPAQEEAPAEKGPAEKKAPAKKAVAEKNGSAEAPAPKEEEPVQPWEFSPYKIQVWLTTEIAPQLSAQVQARISKSIATRIDTMVGAPWQAEVVPPPPELRSAIMIDMDLVTPELLDEVAPETFKLDKIILLAIDVNPREFVVETRELDCRARMFGPSSRRVVRQPPHLDEACFSLVVDAFRAVSRIEQGAPKSAVVRVRAGGLVLSESSPCFVGNDNILLPILRTNERNGAAKSIVPIEWTYLLVNGRLETNPNLLSCRVWSGRPNPIQSRVSARKERYAFKVRPTGTTTTLRVEAKVKRNETPYPMPGLEVYAKLPEPDPPAPPPEPEPQAETESAESTEAEAGEGETANAEDAENAGDSEEAPEAEGEPAQPEPEPAPPKRTPPVLLGHTDWRGSIEVVQGDYPLRLIYLKNGQQLLARLPIVPGLHTSLVAQVPDDAPRLQAEGFIKGIQGQLVDLEAQRQIIAKRFQMRIDEGKLDKAKELLEELRSLPTRNDLVRQLDQQQNQQIPADPRVQPRIDKLYGGIREALGNYLHPGLVNDLQSQLNAASRANPATSPSSPAE